MNLWGETGLTFNKRSINEFRHGLACIHEDLMTRTTQPLEKVLQRMPIEDIMDFKLRRSKLHDAFQKPHKAAPNTFVVQVQNRDIPLLRLGLSLLLRRKSEELERLEGCTHKDDLLKEKREHTEYLEKLLRNKHISGYETESLPHLADFVNLKTYYRLQGKHGVENYDEKFGIHRSPNLFLEDATRELEECHFRKRPVTVAFIDIDGFKDFNTALTNDGVDRHVLPRFMHELEARVYGRGHVYRQGGDEYLMVLPNMGSEEAQTWLDSLREHIASVKFGAPEKPGPPLTLSIGFFTAEPGCPWTPARIRRFANDASVAAKEAGKNCVQAYIEDTASVAFA